MAKAADIKPVEAPPQESLSRGDESKVEIPKQEEAKPEPAKEKAKGEGEGKTVAGLPVLSAGEAITSINMLLYGDPGAGKTRLAASADEVESMRPVLIVDVEGGTKTIRNLYPNVDVMRIRTRFDAGGRIKDSAWDQLDRLYDEAKKGNLEYNTFILDSLTEMYWVYMEHWMRQVVIEHDDRDPDIPAQRDWGKASARIKRLIRRWRDLDSNVIFTALKATIMKGDSGNVLNYTPSLPGKLAYEVTAFVDEVFYLYTQQEKGGQENKESTTVRKLLTENANKYLAKDRSDNLPQVVHNPTMAMLAEMILD